MTNPPTEDTVVLRKKLTFVGGPCSGKTSIIRRFIDNKHSYEVATVFEIFESNVQVDGNRVELTIVDTGGYEDYDRFRPMHYPNTDVLIMCFSITNTNALTEIQEKWYPEVMHHCPSVPIILVGTKTDLKEDPNTNLELRNLQLVETSEARALAAKINAFSYVECSAKCNEGVDMVFEIGARAALQNRHAIRKSKGNCTFL